MSDLKARCLELTVWDYDKLGSNEFLGGIRLSLGASGATIHFPTFFLFSRIDFNSNDHLSPGTSADQAPEWMDSSGDEVTLWQQMLDRPNMWVYGELKLRFAMETRK